MRGDLPRPFPEVELPMSGVVLHRIGDGLGFSLEWVHDVLTCCRFCGEVSVVERSDRSDDVD